MSQPHKMLPFGIEKNLTAEKHLLFLGLHGLPKRNGKLKDISTFDARFFNVSPKQADKMDPGLRMLLEVSYEAILDAGHSI